MRRPASFAVGIDATRLLGSEAAGETGMPGRVDAGTLGWRFPWAVSYTPVRYRSNRRSTAGTQATARPPDLVEVRSATLTRGLPLMKTELLSACCSGATRWAPHDAGGAIRRREPDRSAAGPSAPDGGAVR
jgi:hypothetical protein